MRCLRKLLGITFRDYITNEEVRNRTRQAIGPHEDLLTTVKQRKLRWYGHITRSSGLAKTIMQGTVQGGRRRGRQRKRWEDNIPEWTGLTLGAAMRKAERREEWRELVARISVVPQRSTETTGETRQGKARQGKGCRLHPGFLQLQFQFVGRDGRELERRTVNQEDGGSILHTPYLNLGNFIHPTLACVFRRRH